MEEGGQKKKRVGRYDLLGEIGHGGMAVVYRALDISLKREVALKLLHPHLSSNRQARERFEREAKAVARLHHPAIVEIYDYSGARGEGDTYIVMELVEGTTLRKLLSSRSGGTVPAEAAAMIAHRVFTALAQAHEQDLVHRDVKPENILMSEEGEVKLSDFGIAHLAGVDQMTVTGQILGSPAYMSPEHIEHAELGARADIFSAGTLLYEMAVGVLPFHGNNPHQIIKRIIEGYYDHPLAMRPSVGHHVSSVIVRCLQQEPDRRYQSADEAAADLERGLAAMGIEDIEAELAAFLEDPDDWEERRRPTVVSMTLDLGQRARRAGRLPEAMDHFNRVLALEPGNEKALDAVAGLSRRRRIRRVAERVALAAAIAVALGAILWPLAADLAEEGRDQSSGLSPAAGVSPTVDAGSVAVPGGADGGASDAGSAGEPAMIMRTISPRLRARREVVFTPSPMAVEIVIDGKDRFSFGPANRSRKLPVGPHTISFVPNDDLRFEPNTWKVNVPRGDGPFHFRERLKWRPARVHVECNVDTVVAVPGRSSGRTNTPFEVGIRSGPEETIRVVVAAEGYHPVTKRVTIAAGEVAKVSVELIEKGGSDDGP